MAARRAQTACATADRLRLQPAEPARPPGNEGEWSGPGKTDRPDGFSRRRGFPAATGSTGTAAPADAHRLPAIRPGIQSTPDTRYGRFPRAEPSVRLVPTRHAPKYLQ